MSFHTPATSLEHLSSISVQLSFRGEASLLLEAPLTGLFHLPFKSLPPPPKERIRPSKPPASTVHLIYLMLAVPSSTLAGCVARAALNGSFFICFMGTRDRRSEKQILIFGSADFWI